MAIEAGIKFDWISYTLPNAVPLTAMEMLGLSIQDFAHIHKKRNYYRESYRLDAPNGEKLLEIFAEPDTFHNRDTILIQITGFALSAHATNPLNIDVQDLFMKMLELGGKPTMLHIAMDDLTGQLPWSTILDYSSPEKWQDHVVSTSRRQPCTINNQTVYFGQRRDRNSICIYRKDQEQGTKFPWLRVEYRTTDRTTAKAIAQRIADGGDLGPLAAGLIRRFLDFKLPSLKTKYNRPSAPWWIEFLGGVEKMIISRDLAPRIINPCPTPRPRKMSTILKDLDQVGYADSSELDQIFGWLKGQGYKPPLIS